MMPQSSRSDGVVQSTAAPSLAGHTGRSQLGGKLEIDSFFCRTGGRARRPESPDTIGTASGPQRTHDKAA
jgi:hypothetical protein